MGRPGDRVVFTKAGKSPVIWTVAEVKQDPNLCSWDRHKRKPFFVYLKTKKSRKNQAQALWACGSDLRVLND